MQSNNDFDRGCQPLDALLDELELSNAELVQASEEHLTHKQVSKSRKGRAVTRNIQMKILRALQTRCPDREWALADLFNYKGRV